MKNLNHIIITLFISLLAISSASCSRWHLVIPNDVKPGEYYDMEQGRLYLPENWSQEKKEYNVMVILPGYSASIRSFSSAPQWIEGAEKYNTVLFFVKRDHMGWHEDPKSDDSLLIRNILKDFRKMPWVREKGISIFGFSAGAIMTTSIMVQNRTGILQGDLVDKMCSGSGGFGLIMENALEKDPDMRKMKRIPLYIFWGENEPPGVGPKMVEYLKERNWDIQYDSHQGGHWLKGDHILASLSFASSP